MTTRKWLTNWISARGCGAAAVAVVGVVVLAGLFLPADTYIKWVGHKDLEITFLILDADNGVAVKEATVNVLEEQYNYCTKNQKAPFRLIAGDDSLIKYLGKECMCFGTEGGSGRNHKDTFAIHIPGWYFLVEAPGYTTSELMELDTLENQRNVVRGDKTARLRVVVHLQRQAGAPK